MKARLQMAGLGRRSTLLVTATGMLVAITSAAMCSSELFSRALGDSVTPAGSIELGADERPLAADCDSVVVQAPGPCVVRVESTGRREMACGHSVVHERSGGREQIGILELDRGRPLVRLPGGAVHASVPSFIAAGPPAASATIHVASGCALSVDAQRVSYGCDMEEPHVVTGSSCCGSLLATGEAIVGCEETLFRITRDGTRHFVAEGRLDDLGHWWRIFGGADNSAIAVGLDQCWTWDSTGRQQPCPLRLPVWSVSTSATHFVVTAPTTSGGHLQYGSFGGQSRGQLEGGAPTDVLQDRFMFVAHGWLQIAHQGTAPSRVLGPRSGWSGEGDRVQYGPDRAWLCDVGFVVADGGVASWYRTD